MNNAENCKVVLIGETGILLNYKGVGKTSIISRFVHNKFDSEFMTTLGASYAAKSLFLEEYDKMIKFEVNLLKISDLGYCRARKIPCSVKNLLQR